MKKLNIKQKNWLVFVHVITGAAWFGTAICMVAISILKPWGRQVITLKK